MRSVDGAHAGAHPPIRSAARLSSHTAQPEHAPPGASNDHAVREEQQLTLKLIQNHFMQTEYLRFIQMLTKYRLDDKPEKPAENDVEKLKVSADSH